MKISIAVSLLLLGLSSCALPSAPEVSSHFRIGTSYSSRQMQVREKQQQRYLARPQSWAGAVASDHQWSEYDLESWRFFRRPD